MTKRVLIIATSNAKLGDTGKTTGAYAEELAVPYLRLIDAGADVEIASPLGGALVLDPSSLRPGGRSDASIERFIADPAARAKASATLHAASLDATRFDAVFFPGGHGTMWDLPSDPGVTRIVEQMFSAGKLIASVCHGAAGLVAARSGDGKPVVSGKRINSFTDAEEEAVGLAGVVPFLLESRLRELGGRFEGAPNFQPYAVRDGQFITGQNPKSSALVAELLLDALGLSSARPVSALQPVAAV